MDDVTGTTIRDTLEPFCKEELPLGAIWCSHVANDLASFGADHIPPDMPANEALARLICASRGSSGKATRSEDGRYFNAGGFLQFTVLQRDSIHSWIAHRWPEDKIGKPIDPSLGERLPAFPI